MKYGEKETKNKSSAGSDAGKGVAPWECDPRLIRAGGRSRGLQGKAWTGRGPGRRGFLRACKNLRHPRTSHGRHHFPQATGRQGNGRQPFPRADSRQEIEVLHVTPNFESTVRCKWRPAPTKKGGLYDRLLCSLRGSNPRHPD